MNSISAVPVKLSNETPDLSKFAEVLTVYTKVGVPPTFCSVIDSTSVIESPVISPTFASTPESITSWVGSNVPAYFHLSPTRHTGTSTGPEVLFSPASRTLMGSRI